VIFDERVVDIVHVYKPAEIRQLKKSGQFVEESVRGGEDGGEPQEAEEDEPFDFSEL
jgi:hypothetical protein